MTTPALALLIVGLPFLAGCQQTRSQEDASGSQESSAYREPAVSETSGRAEAVRCDDSSARLAARAYVLSIPLLGREGELTPLMNENPSQFAADGGAIRCMQALGNRLVAGGLAQFRQFSGNSTQEQFGGSMPAELAHLPGQVDTSLRSYGSDQYGMGQELLWLARVLPPAAQGNVAAYNAGETVMRQAMSGVLPTYRMLCQMDPGACQLMLGMFQQTVPGLERQIYDLAVLAGS